MLPSHSPSLSLSVSHLLSLIASLACCLTLFLAPSQLLIRIGIVVNIVAFVNISQFSRICCAYHVRLIHDDAANSL